MPLSKKYIILIYHYLHTVHDVQRFLGLVEYISQFLPNVLAYTTPLSGMCTNSLPFLWRGIHDKCLKTIKAIASQKLLLCPINHASKEPVWVVCDACPSGCGAYYGQGKDWKTMRPTGFMSKKFTDAQCSYFTYEHEMLGVIEALKKWDDELLGLPEIRVVTDHEALKTFMHKAHSGPCQICWSQWLSRYCLKFIHIPGSQNRSADALSRLFENPNNKVQLEDLSAVDLLLDKDGDDLTEEHLTECEMFYLAAVTHAKTIQEVEESHHQEAERMAPPQQEGPNPEKNPPKSTGNDDLTVASSVTKENATLFTWQPTTGDKNRQKVQWA